MASEFDILLEPLEVDNNQEHKHRPLQIIQVRSTLSKERSRLRLYLITLRHQQMYRRNLCPFELYPALSFYRHRTYSPPHNILAYIHRNKQTDSTAYPPPLLHDLV